MTLLPALFVIAIFQGLSLGLIVLKSPIFRSDANKFLAFAVIGLSFSLLSLTFELNEDFEQNLLVSIIDFFSSGALFPVLILLFIVHQVDHPFRHSARRWWFFVPHGLFVLAGGLDIIVGRTGPPQLLQLLSSLFGSLVFLLVLLFIPTVLLYAYSFLKHAKSPKEKRWLTRLWLCVFVIMFSWVSSLFFAVFSYIGFATSMQMIALGASFLIHWITYVGVFKFRLAKDQEEIRALISKWKSGTIPPTLLPPSQALANGDKRSSVLTEENIYFKKLEALCLNERIYLDSTLDRIKVAEKLGISPGYISQIINTVTGENFSTYINRYRVEAAKVMITDAEFHNYSLLAIGLESGFSSKTTFYTAFKKMTGMTPNAYRKTRK